ncbi:MAG TPA: hypothetical protein OIL78_02000 [Coriobacteriaceae bacterium]|nr:hypothetical protein [Coriobacteriaceae bacterium]
MLEQVLLSLRNWFVADKRTGRVRIEGGTLVPPEGLALADGQYIRVTGSVFSDGLHRWPCNGLTDEEFVGTVWALAVPQAVVDLADEIAAWQAEHAKELDSPYASESFGGYSYTRVGGDGSPITWRQQFKARLDPWRKL